METPITDVKLVTSPENCPDGYKILLNCRCGHPANVWQKMLGAKAEQRYLCYTREESKDGKVVADMYIPGKNEKFIIKGYTVIKKTEEGLDSLNHRYLAYQRLDKAKCTKAVLDITIFKSNDSPPSGYKKLGAKLNGVHICVKVADYSFDGSKPVPKPRNTPPKTDTRSQEPPLPRPSDTKTPPNPQPQSNTAWPRPYEVVASGDDKPQWPHPYQFNKIPGYTGPYNQAPPTTYPAAPPTGYYGDTPTYPNTTMGQPYDTPTAPYTPPTGGGASGSTEEYITALGFDHLDMDQPIPDDFYDLEDSPPDSPEPVNEHVDVYVDRPTESTNVDQQLLYQAPPTNNMYYPNQQPGYGAQQYPPGQPGGYYGGQPPNAYTQTNPPGPPGLGFGGGGYYPGPSSQSGYPPPTSGYPAPSHQNPSQQNYSSSIGFKF